MRKIPFFPVKKKADFSFLKTSIALDERYMLHAKLANDLYATQGQKAEFKPLCQSVQHTGDVIMKLFMKLWKKGRVKGNTMRFTYSYLQGAFPKGHQPSTKTLARHVERLMAMVKPFIKFKFRSTLGIPTMDTNCIALTIDHTVAKFNDEALNKAIEQGVSVTPPCHVKSGKKVYDKDFSFDTNVEGKTEFFTENPNRNTAQKIGNLIEGTFFL